VAVAAQVEREPPVLVLLVALAVLDCRIQLLAHQFITLVAQEEAGLLLP
jgi:hypothetical protein